VIEYKEFGSLLDIERPMSKKIRVLLAKPGLDGHDRGIKVIAAAFRDAGMEVIYTGLRQTPAMIVDAAVQEDVDAIGVSILSGAHMTLFPAILDEMKARDAADILLFGGGIIPDDDKAELQKLGVAQIFTPGAPTGDAIAWLRKTIEAKK
jgi:methylmalonyl-CoA mutase C-terminal domain/subunit